ncbi:EAL domain-containing protein [Alkalisalibacterium limincola]|uniref:EAL domain-containing protein n=2 Tax=Alkalisalibacterium limincola TaxID=2699169 RepID=A0A5C8KTU7_9GAMM|nr:EAL domain-containing protein [Alkalisalibacterium limincola]
MPLAECFRFSDSLVTLMRAQDGAVLEVNHAFETHLGYRADEVVGKLPAEIGLWADMQVRASIWAQLRADSKVSNLQVRMRHIDGSEVDGELSAELMEHEGQTVVFCIVQNVRPAGTQPLGDNGNESYRALYLAAAEGIYRSLPGAGFIDVNPAMARIFGYPSPERMLRELGRSSGHLIMDPEHRESLHRRLMAGERIKAERIQVRRADGQAIWISENARAVRDGKGNILFFEGTVVDVTAQVLAEEALQQSQALYKVLVESSHDGVFLIQRGVVVFANQSMADILGMTLEALTGSEYMALVAPSDREAQLQRRAQRESGSMDAQRYEINLVRADGVRILCEVVASAVHYRGDIASTGVIRDVTRQRQIEQALKRSEARYRTLVEHSQVGVFISRGDRYVYANQAMLDLLGYDEETLYSMRFEQLVAPELVPVVRQRLAALARNEPIHRDYESCYIRSDGRRVYVTVSIGPIELDGVDHLTGTVRDITQHREAELRLRFHATHDPLTSLPNRPVFQQRLGDMIDAARRSGHHDYAVLFLDLDGFKWLNDSLGHGAGDRLLVAIAGQLAQVLEGRAMLARYGGDEFTVLPTVPCNRERAVEMAQQILAVFEKPFDIGSQQVFSGASVGIVLGREEYTTPDQVLRDADIAMYATKDRGKSGYTIFDEAMHRLARSRFELETDFRRALERGEFEVHYQPIVELETQRMVACEALVRWRHPTRGLLLPDEFLQVADETGMITELDGWVLREACAHVARWRGRFPVLAALRVNVNVDERQLAGKEIVEEVRSVLERNGLPAEALRLEVTETVFRAGRGHAQERLGALKALGVSLVVDDFGTGYSSLESFASSPFDALKIDRGFVRDMESNSRHRAIVRTIAGFAADLGLSLTAEGVETPGQRQLLLAAGCRHGQGYLFSPALPAHEFEALLLEYARAEA